MILETFSNINESMILRLLLQLTKEKGEKKKKKKREEDSKTTWHCMFRVIFFLKAETREYLRINH